MKVFKFTVTQLQLSSIELINPDHNYSNLMSFVLSNQYNSRHIHCRISVKILPNKYNINTPVLAHSNLIIKHLVVDMYINDNN